MKIIKSISILFVFFSFILFVVGCNDKKESEKENNTEINYENNSGDQPDGIIIEEVVNREFLGTINENLKIKMKLKFSDEVVSGEYSYDGKKEELTLRGQFVDNILNLTEYDSKDNVTGYFEGELTEQYQIVGIWSNPNNTKKFEFVLEEVKNDLSEGKNITGAYSKGDGDIYILYIGDGKVKFQGFAFWNNSVTGGANTGEVAGIENLKNNEIHYSTGPDEYDCNMTIKITKNGLSVTEKTIGTCGGMNVTFEGDYEKISDEIDNWDTYNWMNIY
ncbi:MAG: hypothetical protein JW866_04355 [Ignavibacteriales bacterium]|nr:hypothetical protein [Ignavibacteriales bacterium]